MFSPLIYLLLIQVSGLIHILMIPISRPSKIRRVALETSLLAFLASLVIWLLYFDQGNPGYQFVVDYTYFKIGVDGISIYFVLLTTIIFPIAILSSWYSIDKDVKTFFSILLLLEFLLLCVFLCTDILLFYVFFESILPPLFFMIGKWGSLNKIKASFYLFLYTLFGSLFMLLAFLTLYIISGTTDIQILSTIAIPFDLQLILFIAIFFSFAIKTPLLPVHLWLPLAHAEAPLAGSIILAGIVLKLALYGILRILLPILPEASLFFTPLVYTICVITIIYSCLTTLRQIDFKVVIAYSSIGHMAICILGLFSNTLQGIEGSVILGIAHGLVSPALFFLLGGVIYDRTHSRLISYYRGLVIYMPVLAIGFFISTLANIAIPLSGNFIGEMLSLLGSFERSPILTIFASTSIVLSASYSIWLYNRMMTGSYSPYLPVLQDMNKREFYILFPLLLMTFIIGMNPNLIFSSLHVSFFPLTCSLQVSKLSLSLLSPISSEFSPPCFIASNPSLSHPSLREGKKGNKGRKEGNGVLSILPYSPPFPSPALWQGSYLVLIDSINECLLVLFIYLFFFFLYKLYIYIRR
ncbi:hypothetical protein G7K_6861-t1 [Saitoella complicata NRRL Y-17804]|uniref:NADH:quinone oxidoreductase/Mrp antiporter transmembrane domain-containing protein n=1 Tax=Saitoella complicata (strain BCRC 22490 / CBS 7301 / JCM 7358 / NBRC 10748 / NRRL Y-17804) TaxID=698492 RepID=A0A0E9NSF9_SAICN|nr:hypothetical protein G7K_6861-t1 [Saitoella complicata NRRL Y-17804]